jgi:hypothetical protein
MTGSKIESARKLLASGIPPRDVAKDLRVSSYALPVDPCPCNFGIACVANTCLAYGICEQ